MNKQMMDDVKRIWNETFAGTSAVQIVSFSKERRRRLSLRCDEWRQVGEPLEVFTKLCQFIAGDKWHMSPAARGTEHRNWRVSIDYLIRNDTKWLQLWERAQSLHQPRRRPRQPAEDPVLADLYERYKAAAVKSPELMRAIAERKAVLAGGPDLTQKEWRLELERQLKERGITG